MREPTTDAGPNAPEHGRWERGQGGARSKGAVNTLRLPRRFGPYVIVRHLNEGGMGTVQLAVTGKPGLEKACVLKQMLPEAAAVIPEQEARFRREAQIVRRLSHGSIAQTLAVGDVDGTPFIAQEFIHGRDLSQVMNACTTAGERIPTPVAVHVVREVARALAYAHEFEGLGLVHRDVTPQNVMLGFAGEIKLVDFGIAKSRFDPSLTQPGAMLGRRNYMAPEVLAGGDVDPRADLYSLGVVLWELLAGRLLSISGGSSAERPAPSAFNPDVPADLDAIAMRAIAWLPDDRFQSAQELHSALGPFVPRAFMGDAAVRDFLARQYDVDRQRKLLRDELATATTLLDPTEPISDRNQPAERSRRLWPWVVGTAAFVTMGAVVATTGRGGRGAASTPAPSLPSNPSTSPVAIAPPAVPPPAAVAPPPRAPNPEPPEAATVTPPPRQTQRPAIPARKHRPDVKPAERGGVENGHAEPSATELLAASERSYAEGRTDEAIRQGRAAIERGGGARAHAWLGSVFLQLGRNEDAVRQLELATRLDPSDVTATSRLEIARKRVRATNASSP